MRPILSSACVVCIDNNLDENPTSIDNNLDGNPIFCSIRFNFSIFSRLMSVWKLLILLKLLILPKLKIFY